MATTTETSTAEQTSTLHAAHDAVVLAQLESLASTDCYASAWSEALAACSDGLDGSKVAWGGRGKGGRGLARRTFQPKDAIVDDVRLEYLQGRRVGDGSSKRSGARRANDQIKNDALLDGATLKVLHGHVYALLGRNGCGKSTLLRRLHAGKIPGLSPHLTSLYLPQELPVDESDASSCHNAMISPLDVVLGYHKTYAQNTRKATRSLIEELEQELEGLQIGDDNAQDDQQDEMERICEQIAELEEHVEEGCDARFVREQAIDALRFFFVREVEVAGPITKDGSEKGAGDDEYLSWLVSPECDYFSLSEGERKKVLLSVAMLCRPNVLLLDEPTTHVDTHGLLQLRRLITHCQERGTAVLLVSHDVDLINDAATDIMYFYNRQLLYYPGNYDNFKRLQQQQNVHALRQEVMMEKKRQSMLNTLDHLQRQPVPKRGGAKKKAKAIASHKRKMDRHLNEEANGAGTGPKLGSENVMQQLLRQKIHTKELPPPPIDKAIQFIFRNTASVWGEPLVTALDVGHGYGIVSPRYLAGKVNDLGMFGKKDGYLFDCVDLCVEEGSTICILGNNGSGTSVLLRILAKLEKPKEGKVHHATGIRIGYFEQSTVDNMVTMGGNGATALSYLKDQYPQKTEQELRGQLTSFGLSPAVATTTGRQFLSGGERSRLCLASVMLNQPDVLFMESPTSNLDAESVEAMIHGLKQWNGTIVMASHDANFLRSLGATCYVIVQPEGKLRRVHGGIDAYLKAFRG